jgi:hypothetical protein
MILQGICRKCNTPVKLDVGTNTVEDTITILRKLEGFTCPGHHVEMSTPYPNYWDVHNWELVEGSAPTEEEFVETLRKANKYVRTTDEMQGLITGFAMGFPMTSDGLCWQYVHSPRGRRWYISNG